MLNKFFSCFSLVGNLWDWIWVVGMICDSTGRDLLFKWVTRLDNVGGI